MKTVWGKISLKKLIPIFSKKIFRYSVKLKYNLTITHDGKKIKCSADKEGKN